MERCLSWRAHRREGSEQEGLCSHRPLGGGGAHRCLQVGEALSGQVGRLCREGEGAPPGVPGFLLLSPVSKKNTSPALASRPGFLSLLCYLPLVGNSHKMAINPFLPTLTR